MHLLKETVTMQTEVRVNYLNCRIHVPSNQVLANREANSRHTYDVTIWLSRTSDNSNILSGPVKFEITRVDCTCLFGLCTIIHINQEVAGSTSAGLATFFPGD